MLHRVDHALRQMRREHARITVAAVARRADVSRTFLYQNQQARALITTAAANRASPSRQPDPAELSWRQRALNAEQELRRAHNEIAAHRTQIGELLGRIRDLQHDLPNDGVQRVLEENRNLKVQLRQAAQDNRLLTERLAGARDNNRSLDGQIARLEAELADRMAISGAST
jgi:chromosome segregation ATPase